MDASIQSNSLERLQKAGEIMQILSKIWDAEQTKMNQSIINGQINNSNAQNLSLFQGLSHNEQNKMLTTAFLDKAKQASQQLKSSATWLTNVLPNIMDYFLIIALAIFPIKIIIEIITGTTWAMTLFFPNNNNLAYAKQTLALILYLPAVVVGYFAGNIILNYIIEFAIGMSFSSIQYNQLDFDGLKTIIMMFSLIAGFVAISCATLILALPMAINTMLRTNFNDDRVAEGNRKTDGAIGSSNATHVQASNNTLYSSKANQAFEDSWQGNQDMGKKYNDIQEKDEDKEAKLVWDNESVPLPKRERTEFEDKED